MRRLSFIETATGSIASPPAGARALFIDDNGVPQVKMSTGSTSPLTLGSEAVDFHGAGPAKTDAQNRDAFRDAFVADVTRITLAGGTYSMAMIQADADVQLRWTSGNDCSVIIPEGFTHWDGRGSTISYGAASRGVWCMPYATWGYDEQHVSYAASDVAAGDQAIPLETDEGANWTVGDTGLWMLGSLADDLPETQNWGLFEVTAKSTDTITLDRPLPEGLVISGATGYTDKLGHAMANKAFWKMPLVDGQVYENQRFVGNGYNVEEGIRVRGGRNITVRNCHTDAMGIGVQLQFVESALIERCSFVDNKAFGTGVEKGISLAETRDVTMVSNRMKGIKQGTHLEAMAEGQVLGGLFENTGDPVTNLSYGTDCEVFITVSKARLSVRDYTITGHGGYHLHKFSIGVPGQEGDATFEGRIAMIHPEEPYSFPLEKMNCLLDYRIAGVREEWDFTNAYWWKRRITLTDGMTTATIFRGPVGIVKMAKVYASTGLTFGTGNKLTGLYLRRASGAAGANLATSLTAGSTVKLAQLYGGSGLGGNRWTYRAEQIQLRCTTDTGLTGEYLDVELLMVPDRLTPDMAWSAQADETDSFT